MKDRILKRFNDEIAVLERELKVDLPKEIQRARELGDLRENAEYKAAKERQSYLQARLGQLYRRLAALSMTNLDRIPQGKVGLGSTVTVRETGSGEELIYELKSRYTIVIVTHNMQQAARVSDYTAFMYMGKLIEYGDTDTLFTNPAQKQTEDYITGRYG